MNGYNELAGLMASHPSLAIFRRFRTLNDRDLLCLQAELVHLEADLKRILRDDDASGDAEKVELQYDMDALMLSRVDTERKHQYEKTIEIRGKLREYYAALLQAAALQRLCPPNELDLNTLRTYLDRAKDKNASFLSGREAWTWDEQYTQDFVTFTDRYRDKDLLSRAIDKYFMPWYDRTIGSRFKDPIVLAESWSEDERHKIELYNYPDTTVSVAVNTVSTVIAPLLPIVGIFALHFVRSPLVRIGLIALFTVAFSISVTLLTRARRVDVFTSTAAFAAILLVFVGSDDGQSGRRG